MQHHFFTAIHLRLCSLLLAIGIANSYASPATSHHHDSHATIGKPGIATAATRTIRIDMDDNMRFSLDHIQIKQGETITFIVNNNGKIRHEMIFGSDTELKDHYAAMLKNPHMEHTDD